MCDKISYGKGEARRIAQGMSRVHNQTMEPYWCDYCDCWHIRTAGKVKRKIKDDKYPFRFQYEVNKKKGRKENARRK